MLRYNLCRNSRLLLNANAATAGTFVGALAAAYLADHTGRRLGLIFSSLLFIVGVVLQAISVSLPLFIVGRGIAGTGVGLLSAIGKLLLIVSRRAC